MIDASWPAIHELLRNVHCTWIEVRGPSAFDQGEIAFVYFVVNGELVVLTDAQGRPCKNDSGAAPTVQIGPRQDVALVARRLARKASREHQARHAPLMVYEQAVIV
jgi:hypothetical protein